MKTSVTKIMMSVALMGCLIIGASDASAQGRSRSQGGSTSSRSQTAAVSRSNNTTAPIVSRNSSPSVSRSSSATQQVNRSSSATPQVNRSTPSRSTSENRGTVSRPSSNNTTTSHSTVDRGNSSSRNDNKGSRVGSGATTRTSGSTSGTVSNTRRGDINNNTVKSSSDWGKIDKTDRGTSTTSTRPSTVGKPGGKPNGNGNDKPNGNGNNGFDKDCKGNGNNGNSGIHNDHSGNKGGRNDNNGIHNDRHGNKGDRNGNRPGGNNDHKGGKPNGNDKGGKHGGNRGYNPDHRYDYNNHHYRDEFRRNYSSHNWSRPLPPPARAHRPAPIVWYRPVIPAGWHPYAGAPVIDRILGLIFGSLYESSLDYLYYNGYYIDGYADNIIYLRDVPMLNLYWPDVMLNYEYGKLVNAQFIYHSSYYDRSRFNRAYNSLCRIYGSPVFNDGMTASWFGGNSTGWVTLTLSDSYGDYYTTMSIGY